MTTKTDIKWFYAQEAKRGRIAHLAGHRRLGGEFSKCGKRLGRRVGGGFDPCAACAIEQNKEVERAKKVATIEAGIKTSVPAAREAAITTRVMTGKDVPTPELDKLATVAKTSQKIGEFLDWLQNEKGYSIAAVAESSIEGRLVPIHASAEKLTAEYFKIDLKKAEAERRAILDAIRRPS